jgi:DNA-binding transcriptional LysR family regulator
LHDWVLAGKGLAWRSMWEVGADIEAGRLRPVLEGYSAPGNDIYAVFAQRRHLPLRIRALSTSCATHTPSPAIGARAEPQGQKKIPGCRGFFVV